MVAAFFVESVFRDTFTFTVRATGDDGAAGDINSAARAWRR